MTRLQKLREAARKLYQRLTEAREAAKEEDGTPRLLTDEERTEQDEGLVTLDKYDKDIATEVRLAILGGNLPGGDSDPPSPASGDDEGDETRTIEVGSDRWLSRGFPTIGEQLQAIIRGSADGAEPDKRLLHLNATGGDPELRVASGQSETEPGLGGFMLQKDFQTAIRERSHGESEILPRVNFTPLSQSATGLKFNVVAEDSRVNGSRGGGVRAYWTDEAAAFTASTIRLRQIELSLSKLTGLMYATNELQADAPALGARAVRGFGDELRFKTELAFFSGDGAGKPLGILAHSGTLSVPKESGQLATTLVTNNIFNMYNRCRNRANSVWMINLDVEPQLWTMTMPVGTGGLPTFLPPGALSSTPYATLLGRPVIPIEYAPTLGAAGDITLCDWDAYEAIDKGSPESASSMHVRFLFDEDTFRIIYRVDGQPLHKSKLTPFQGTTTTAHFVNTAVRE